MKKNLLDREPVRAVVMMWRLNKPSRIELRWAFNNEFLCGIGNKDALLLASRILQLQKGKPKVKPLKQRIREEMMVKSR